MGIVSKQLSQSNNMKFLLVLAVAAYARAEADPGFAYSVGAAPLVYNHLPVAYHHPLAAAAAPAEAAEEAVVSVEKREAEPTAEADAEADPEADSWLLYHGLGYAGYGYHGYHPLSYSYAPYTYASVYRHYGLPYHYGYYGKREAEPTAEPAADAEADPEADPWLYYHGLGYAGLHPYGYGYHGLGYAYAGYGYHPYAYGGYGCRNGYGALVPCAGR